MIEALRRVIRRVARRYVRRCWWADVEDLEQWGWIAALEAQRTWRPAVGVPLECYAEQAIALALRAALWRASAPVSCSTSRRDLPALGGLHRASLEDHLPDAADLGAEIEAAMWRAEVRRALHAVMGDDHAGLGGLLADEVAGETAHRLGVPVREVYRARQRVHRYAARSAELRALWAEGEGS